MAVGMDKISLRGLFDSKRRNMRLAACDGHVLFRGKAKEFRLEELDFCYMTVAVIVSGKVDII